MSSLLQAIEGEFRSDLFTQIHRILVDKGKLLIRSTSQELISGMWLYRYFPSGRSDVESRTPKLDTIVRWLIESSFHPKCIHLVEDATDVTIDELLDRLAEKPFSWCDKIKKAEFDEGLRKIKSHYGLKPGVLQWQQPAWLIVAERLGA